MSPPVAGGAVATRRGPAARPAIPAKHFIPIWMAGAHDLLGGATLVVVLRERAGIS